MTISIAVRHLSAQSDKAVRVSQQPPQGPPVIHDIQPGTEQVFDVSDCNELHVYEWDAAAKDEVVS